MVPGKARRHYVEALIDSGSTGNFVSTQFVEQSGLHVKGDGEQSTLADGSKSMTEGAAHVALKSGPCKCQIQAQVFPDLCTPLILGMPWLKVMDPQINWSDKTITVQQNGQQKILPNITTLEPRGVI